MKAITTIGIGFVVRIVMMKISNGEKKKQLKLSWIDIDLMTFRSLDVLVSVEVKQNQPVLPQSL